MKNNKKRLILIILTSYLVFLMLCLFAYPSINQVICKNRYFKEFDETITEDVLNSNIVICVHEQTTDEDGSVYHTWTAGSSGVIIDYKDDTYFALTAYHVVKNNVDSTEFIILPYNSPTYTEFRENSNQHVSLQSYYEQFEKAKVIYAEEKYDLALISFKSSKPLHSLSVSKYNPSYNEKVVSISNPEGERFVKTYGKIKSKKYYTFKSNDDLLPIQTLKHNAYISYGSSGSALLNQQMEIVGINVGAKINIFNGFWSAVMVPSEIIQVFLKENYY